MAEISESLPDELRYVSEILRSSRDVLYCLSFEKLKFQYVSPSIVDLVGYTPEEMVGMGPEAVRNFYHPDDLKLPKDHKGAFMSWDGIAQYRVRHKDGHYIWVQSHRNFSTDKTDGLVRSIGCMRDMSKLREIQQQSFLKDQQMGAVFESSADCILVWDREYNYLYANKAAIEHVGATADKVIGHNMRSGLGHVPEFMRLWMGRVDEVFAIGKSIRVEDCMDIGGRMVCSESVVSPIRDDKGNIFAVSCVYRDITDKMELQRQLKASEQKYRELYDDAQVALFRSRITDGKLIECNAKQAKMLGYETIEECLSDFYTLSSYVNPNDRSRMLKLLKDNGQVNNFECEVKRRDGTAFWTSISAKIHPEKGYLEGASIDITTRKLLTRTELKVLGFIMQGMSNKEIGFKLDRSVRTIEDHRASIMSKLDVSNPIELARKAIDAGF